MRATTNNDTTVRTMYRVQMGYNTLMRTFDTFNEAKKVAKGVVNKATAKGLNVYVVRIEVDYVKGNRTKYYKIFA